LVSAIARDAVGPRSAWWPSLVSIRSIERETGAPSPDAARTRSTTASTAIPCEASRMNCRRWFRSPPISRSRPSVRSSSAPISLLILFFSATAPEPPATFSSSAICSM